MIYELMELCQTGYSFLKYTSTTTRLLELNATHFIQCKNSLFFLFKKNIFNVSIDTRKKTSVHGNGRALISIWVTFPVECRENILVKIV